MEYFGTEFDYSVKLVTGRRKLRIRKYRVKTCYMKPEALAHQPTQKLALIHPVFEGFTAVDEYHGNFVIELPPQFVIAVYIHFLPCKCALPRKFRKTFFHHLAEMAPFSRVNHDLAGLWHE
jgi:hypothetical protein